MKPDEKIHLFTGQAGHIETLIDAPEIADNLASEYSLALQEKYLRLKIKASTTLIEKRNLRQQLNNLTKRIGLKLTLS